MDRQATAAFINDKLALFDQRNQNLAILLVVTMQDEVTPNDYEEFSVRTTYASNMELSDIVIAFKAFAAYIDVSYGERDFIKKITLGHYDKLSDYRKVVYTETATGTARSKSALTPALCELYGLHVCSNDTFTAALLDNKLATLHLLQHLGFPTPRTWVYSVESSWLGAQPPAGVLLIAKPAYEAASIGITAKSVGELSNSYLEHLRHISSSLRQPVLVQELVQGAEVEVPVFDFGEPFCPGVSGISIDKKTDLGAAILNYHTIFDDSFDLYEFESHDPGAAAYLKQLSCGVFNSLHLRGPIRIDYRINREGKCFIIDYNNSPHLGKHHSFAFLIESLGFTYHDVLKLVVLRGLLF